MPVPESAPLAGGQEPPVILASTPPSREPSLKGRRGLSSSNITAIGTITRSRSTLNTSPMVQPLAPLPDAYGRRPSLDQPPHPRSAAPVLRHHTRQISSAYEPTSLRHQVSNVPQDSAKAISHGQRAQPASITPAKNGVPPTLARAKSNRDGNGLRAVLPSDTRAISPPSEPVGINEIGLTHLFTFYSTQAHDKINACLIAFDRSQFSFRIEQICGEGVDTTFDMTIAGLGAVAKEHPKSLIDQMLKWRSQYTPPRPDSTATAHSHSLSNSSQATSQTPSRVGDYPSANTGNTARSFDPAETARYDLRTTVASFLLGRVMIEVLSQTTLSALTLTLAHHLEAIIYRGQIDNVLPEELLRSPTKRSKWQIMTRLLGIFSELDLEGTAECFLGDIDRLQTKLGPKTNTNTSAEETLVARLEGMQYFRLRSDSAAEWQRSRSFMQAITKLIGKTHGQAPKREYCKLLENVLLPLAGQTSTEPLSKITTPEFSNQMWKNIINVLQDRIQQLAKKPKYYHAAFPAQVVLACVSGTDVFNARWNQLLPISSLATKLKNDADRSMYLKALCRFTWSFLRREANPDVNRVDKVLEDIARAVFFSPKRFALSTDPSIAEPLIVLLRIMAYHSMHHQKLVFSRVIFPLLNAELLLSDDKDIKLEQLDPDRVVLGIRAFLAIMGDLESQQPPQFPLDFADEWKERGIRRTSFQLKKLSKDHGQGGKPPLDRGERLSKPVLTAHFHDMTKTFYEKFCEMLGTITQICNTAFGGQASIDEKLAPVNTKTPLELAVSSLKRDAGQAGELQRSLFHDLFHVAVQALPRCRPRNIPMPYLVNLLCIGTAHEQPQIAKSSTESLKAIARQGFAQILAERFGGFILNYDNRYSTMSDGGMLGQRHIDNTLRLYVELLSLWVEELRGKVRAANLQRIEGEATQPGQLDTSNVWSQVDRLESQGLFFLCSPTPSVRGYAVQVLELVTELEDVLGQHNERISRTLHGGVSAISIPSDEELSGLDVARLSKKPLPQLCCSDDDQDSSLWSRLFPRVIRTVFGTSPMAVTPTREDVCTRLYQMQDAIEDIAIDDKTVQTPSQSGSFDADFARYGNVGDNKKAMIEQWKFYLMFACTTLNKTGIMHDPSKVSEPAKSAVQEPQKRTRGNSQTGTGLTLSRRPTHASNGTSTDESRSVASKDAAHTRNPSSSSQPDSLNTAADLFSKVIPLLFASNKDIAHAAVAGLGSINPHLFKLLLESIAAFSHARDDDNKRGNHNHTRTASSPRKPDQIDIFRFEVVQVYQMTTSRFMQPGGPAVDDWVLHHVSNYTKELAMWLQREENRRCGDALKIQCCGLIEAFWPGIADREDVHSLYPFQARKASFILTETWYYEASGKTGEARKAAGTPIPLHRNDTWTDVSKAKDQSILRQAACKAMAALCAGKIQIMVGNVTHAFSGKRILDWIVELLDRPEERQASTGRRALRNLLKYNTTDRALLDQALELLYAMPPNRRARSLAPFTNILVEVFIADKSLSLEYWRILSVLLLALGNSDRSVRMAAVKLLRSYEGRQKETSKLHQLEIMVSDKTTNVYKQAQYEISARLAQRHSSLACHVFSDLARIFVDPEQEQQLQLMPVILPWLNVVELQVSPDRIPTPGSYMVLVNLLEITRKYGAVLYTEIQGLWHALLAWADDNLPIALNFCMELCTARQFQRKWPGCVQRVMVFMKNSGTMDKNNPVPTLLPNAAKVFDFLLSRLTPKAMVSSSETVSHVIMPPAGVTEMFPYVADIGAKGGIFDTFVDDATMSLGQNCLVLLVDLIVAPVQFEEDKVPGLLHLVMLLWDYHADIIREHAREMLVHLVHELVITRLDNTQMEQLIPGVEELVNQIRSNDRSISWTYKEKADQHADHEVPPAMPGLVRKTIAVFALVYPNIEQEWGKQAMVWAGCPVMHMACRSLQVYRCFLKPLDMPTVSGLVLLLSSIVAREDDASKQYAMELLRTCRSIAQSETRADGELLPLLFWTVYASLETPNEPEFRESLAMLKYLLGRLDFSSSQLIDKLDDSRPSEWQLDQGLLTALVYKGCRSRDTYIDTIIVLDSLIVLPANSVIGDNTRVLFCFLANLPRFLEHFDEIVKPEGIISSAANLASAAKQINEEELWGLLQNFVKGMFLSVDDFLREAVRAISALSFFHNDDIELQSLNFVMGMLGNNTPWIKEQTLKILEVLMPIIDLRKPELANQGPDLVMPLLRLLQSDYLPQALKVLDNVLPLKSTPLGPQHLEMSMVGSRSSQAIRRAFDDTKSFYGIPETSGWSVPQPKTTGLRVAGHIHLLGQSIAPANNGAMIPTPELQFYREGHGPSDYFVTSATKDASEEEPFAYPTVQEEDMGELVTQLGVLDDFFDEPAPDIFPALSRQSSNEQSMAPDGRTVRNGANKGFGELRATPPRVKETMSPSSFAVSPPSTLRPGMLSRAMTSPAVEKRTPAESHFPAATMSELDPLSDDDVSAGRTSTSDRSLVALTTTTSSDGGTTRARSGSKSSGLRSGLRSVSRRLTGARRAQLEVSPEVPKVPDFYMNNSTPQSSEL